MKKFDEAFENFRDMKENIPKQNQELTYLAHYGFARVAHVQGNVVKARQQGQEALAALEALHHEVDEIKQ